MPRTGTRCVLLLTGVLLLAAGAPGGTVGASTGSTDVVTLTVTVVGADGERVGGADLTATWDGGTSSATTASNGKAFLDVETGAEVELTVDHPDYIRNHPFVVEEASERDVTVPVARRGQLRVSAVDSAGPVSNAEVTVRMDGRIAASGQTGADGTFATGDIEQGDYSVSVVKPGYYRNTTTVTVAGENETHVAIERGSVTLTVTVHDPHFDPPEPVSDAQVSIASIGQFRTLPEGRATVGVPVNTPLTIAVTKSDYETVRHDVRVRESALTENVSLRRTPNITISPVNRRVVAGERVVVEVADEYGDPVAGATVSLDGESVGETDAGGQLAVRIESSGEHTLVASAENLESAPATVTAIREGGESATPTETVTTTTTSATTEAGGSGFSVLLALVALAALALVGSRRRRE